MWSAPAGEPSAVVLRGHLIADAAVWVRLYFARQVKACLTKFGGASKLNDVCRETHGCAVLTGALFAYSFSSFQDSRHRAPLSCDYLNSFYNLLPLLDFIKP